MVSNILQPIISSISNDPFMTDDRCSTRLKNIIFVILALALTRSELNIAYFRSKKCLGYMMTDDRMTGAMVAGDNQSLTLLLHQDPADGGVAQVQFELDPIVVFWSSQGAGQHGAGVSFVGA